MALQNISYTNKEALNQNSSVADINKVKADDMNEIKSVVNNTANAIVDYIVETGTTTGTGDVAGWKYEKYASGKIILMKNIAHTGMTITSQSAGTYYGGVKTNTLPYTLSTVDFIGMQETSPRSSGVYAYTTSISQATLTTEFRAHAAMSNGTGSCGVTYYIVGTI